MKCYLLVNGGLEELAQQEIEQLINSSSSVHKGVIEFNPQSKKEILKLIGADEVILPEQAIGRRLADALSLPFMDHTRVSEDFSISQLSAPKQFVGKKPSEIPLYEKYKVQCIGMKVEEEIVLLPQDYEIQEGDTLLFAGKDDALEAIAKL